MGEPAPSSDPLPADDPAALAALMRRIEALADAAEAELAAPRCGDEAWMRHLVQSRITWRGVASQLGRITFGAARAAEAREDGRREMRQEMLQAAVPGQRKPRQGRHAKRMLSVVPAIAVAVLLLRRTIGRHPVLAAAKTALAAHRIAALTTSLVAAGGTAAVLTVTALAPSAALPFTGPDGAPAPAASIEAATPVSSPIALLVTHPKSKHSAKGKTLLASAGAIQPPYYVPASGSSSASSSQPSSSAAVQAGPATLSISAASLDLSLTPQATFTISATGSGWASWHISTSGTDLDFSPAHGVLQAGQSVQVTVSLDPSQDGLTSQAFTVDGQTVTVNLPLPVPVPSVSASPVVSIPPLGASPSPS
jgi:hypothetical protein